MKKQIWILVLITVIGTLIAIITLFPLFRLSEETAKINFYLEITQEIRIPANPIHAALSPDKKWLFIVTCSTAPPQMFKIILPLKKIEREHIIAVPLGFYIWNFFWVGKWLVLQGLNGDPFVIERELDGKFGKYANNAEIIAWNEEVKISSPSLPPGFGGDGWKRVMRKTSLYASFVPGPDNKTMAILTPCEVKGRKEFKGFLYSLPEGRRLKEVKWRGIVFEGPYYTSIHYPRAILVWDKDGKNAWSVDKGSLVSVNFEGKLRKLNGKHKGEWLYSNKLYAQPVPDRIAVIIFKDSRKRDLKEIYLAHYSSTQKLWEARIPWGEIVPTVVRWRSLFNLVPWMELRKAHAEVVAITPDGKGIVFQDGMGKEIGWDANKVRIWLYRVGDRKPKLIAQASPIEEAIGWLSEKYMLVVVGNDKKRGIGVLEIK